MRWVLVPLAGCVPYEPPCVITTWYADGDSDGFGDAAASEILCEAPPGYVSSVGDCDDRDPGVSPAAAEVCDGADDDCDGEVDEGLVEERFLDRDGDGWGDEDTATTTCLAEVSLVLVAGDCDDLDPLTWPGAEELCDDRDNDCDRRIDDGLGEVWYLDLDGDGFGATASGVRDCSPWSGAVAVDGDCDDVDPERFPGAVEVCGFVDDDCDGAVDEEPADGLAWIPDGDGDGYGDAAGAPRLACVGVPGEVLDASDCGDGDPTIHPGAIERCDGVDHDCDGLLGEADPDVDPAALVAFYADLDGDGFGAGPVAGLACEAPPGHAADATDCDDGDDTLGPPFPYVGDLDGDGYGSGPPLGPVCALPPLGVPEGGPDDCDDVDPLTHPLASEVCDDLVDQDCDGRDASCHPALAGTLDLDDVGVRLLAPGLADLAGFSVAGAGDVDGDGFDDVVVGGPDATGGEGAGWLVRGPIELQTPLSGADAFPGVGASDQAGYVVAPAGDLDGDGLAELLLGGPGWSGTGTAWIVRGPAVGGPLSAVTDRLEGTGAGFTGAAVLAPGDLDGDGVPDLVIASPEYSTVTRTACGRVSVMPGPFSGPVSITTASLSWYGATGDDRLGSALAPAGDTDGDGVRELWLGAPDDGGDGEVYLVEHTVGVYDLSGWPDLIDGDSGDRFGAALQGEVDLDGDGYDDLVAGAPGSDRTGTDAGAVYVFLGPIGGVQPLSAAAAVLDGTLPGERAGTAVAMAWDQLAVGAPASDGFGLVAPVGPGSVYLVDPPLAGTQTLDDAATAILRGTALGDAAGYSVAAAGDADRDGGQDLIVGAPLAGGGTAWIVYGP